MPKRQSMGKSHSRKVFTKGALRVHPKNGLRSVVMRGGIRL